MAKYQIPANELQVLIASLGGGLQGQIAQLPPDVVVKQCEKMLMYAKDYAQQVKEMQAKAAAAQQQAENPNRETRRAQAAKARGK